MTKNTKEKFLNKKNQRILIITSICVLTICVVLLPIIAFRYTKNKLGVVPPPSEEITNPTNTNPQGPQETMWTCASTDLFYYAPVENSSDVLILGLKEDASFATEYVILPNEIQGGSKIVGVADNAFSGNEKIKGLVIPNLYYYIGENAFNGNTSLTSLVVGNTKEETAESLASRPKMSVEIGAFEGCTSLESLTIGASVESVSESFSGCTSLKEIVIYSRDVYEGAFVETTLGGVFEFCSKVLVYSNAYSGANPYFSKFYTMGHCVIDGETYTEYDLVKVLYEIKLKANGGELVAETLKYEPNSTKELPIPEMKHYDFCGWFRSSDFSGEPIENVAEDMKGCFELYAKWEPTVYDIHYICGTATNTENPENFTILSDDVVFKDPIRNGYLFSGWFRDSSYSEKVEKLSDLIDGEDATSVAVYAKFDALFTGTSYISGLTAEAKARNLKSITIPAEIDGATVSKIGENAFSGLLFEEVIVNANLDELVSGAFKNCVNLKKVVFNSSTLRTIGEDAFSGCSALESINVSRLSILSTIGNNAFKNCTSLKEIDLRVGLLVAINANAFAGCTGLESIYFSGNLNTIRSSAFMGCTNLSYVNWSDMVNLKEIGSSAFKNCSSLVSIEFPKTITKINEEAFKGCSGLKVVNLSKAKNLTKLSRSAFEDCISLQSVTFREKLTTIESSAFKNCTSLSEIVLPATLTQIDIEAFVGSGVQSVTFLNPENWCLVESVGESVEGVKSLDLSIVTNNAKNLKGEYSSKILIKRI